MLKDWNFWLTVASLLVAFVAIFQTQKQVRLSNKQQLFQQRLKTYSIIDGLIALFQKHHFLLENEEKNTFLEVNFVFVSLTNNSYLYDITPVLVNPLNNPEHINFLKKLEELKQISKQIKFIFPDSQAIILSSFVWNYQQLLFSLYQYQIMKKDALDAVERHGEPINIIAKKFRENEQRDELYDVYDKLKESYNQIEDNETIKKIEKTIRLK